MKIKLSLLLIPIILFINCTSTIEPEDGYPFAIYFLKNNLLKIDDVHNTNIDSLKLKSTPWLINEDLEFYDWSSHCLYINKNKDHFITGWDTVKIEDQLFNNNYVNKPFVVLSNNIRVYIGYYHSDLYSQCFWPYPMIFDLYYDRYLHDVIMLNWIVSFTNSPLNNSQIRSSLNSCNLYRAGIEIILDQSNLNSLKVIDNADTSTIEYSYTIVNNDEDDLYILDPDKSGGDIFHLFTNGINFKNIDTGEILYSKYKDVYSLPNLKYWSYDWFIKLESMSSITRKVMLKGYPRFPKGEYQVELSFSNPPYVNRTDSRFDNGRYWLGVTKSNKALWIY